MCKIIHGHMPTFSLDIQHALELDKDHSVPSDFAYVVRLSSWLSLLDTGFTSWFLWVEYAGVPYRLASCACQNDLAFFHFLLVHSTRLPLAWIMHTAHPINLQHALLNAQGFLISFLFGTEPSSTENKAIERLLRTNHSCQAAEMKGDTPVDGTAACGIEGGGAAASKSRNCCL